MRPITENGLPRAIIVLPEGAQPVEEHAARELRRYIGEISGAQLSIDSAATDAAFHLYVGTGFGDVLRGAEDRSGQERSVGSAECHVSVGDRICRDKRQIEVEDFVLSSVPADGILVQNQFTASQCWHEDVELGARLREDKLRAAQ